MLQKSDKSVHYIRPPFLKLVPSFKNVTNLEGVFHVVGSVVATNYHFQVMGQNNGQCYGSSTTVTASELKDQGFDLAVSGTEHG